MQLKRLWPSISWAIIILILVGFPGEYIPKVTTFWDWLSPDKFVHTIIFGVQAYLLLYGFNVQSMAGKTRGRYMIALFIISVSFAALTEILQIYVFIGRFGNLFDFLADVSGVIVGFVAYYLLNIKKNRAGN